MPFVINGGFFQFLYPTMPYDESDSCSVPVYHNAL